MSEFNQNHTNVQETKRVAEMILGAMGSALGMLGGYFVMFLGGLSSAFEDNSDYHTIHLGQAVILVCVITLVLSCIINKQRVLIGILLIIGGVLNLIFISFFGILSGLLIIVAGILALTRK